MLALVMHNFSQVSPALRETILANCDVMAVFRTSARNAQFFGEFLPELDPQMVAESLRRSGRVPTRPEMHTQMIEHLQRLPNRHCYWYDRRRPYRALLLRVPDLPHPHTSIGLSAQALDAFMAAEQIRRGGVAVPKAMLHRQIEARHARLRQLVQPPIQVHRPPVEKSVAEVAPQQPRNKGRKPRLG